MHRRQFLSSAAALALPQTAAAQPRAKLGIDLFSLRSQNWTPFQYLDYCAKQRVQVVHFSEIRFIGSLDPENLRAVRRRAEELGIEIEIGMTSTCPTSKAFNPKLGTAEEQLARMIDAPPPVSFFRRRACAAADRGRPAASEARDRPLQPALAELDAVSIPGLLRQTARPGGAFLRDPLHRQPGPGESARGAPARRRVRHRNRNRYDLD